MSLLDQVLESKTRQMTTAEPTLHFGLAPDRDVQVQSVITEAVNHGPAGLPLDEEP